METAYSRLFSRYVHTSSFGLGKAELLQKGPFAHLNDAYTEIFEYIAIYYNKKGRHSGINHDFYERFEIK